MRIDVDDPQALAALLGEDGPARTTFVIAQAIARSADPLRPPYVASDTVDPVVQASHALRLAAKAAGGRIERLMAGLVVIALPHRASVRACIADVRRLLPEAEVGITSRAGELGERRELREILETVREALRAA